MACKSDRPTENGQVPGPEAPAVRHKTQTVA